ncbi:DUF4286 family protein [Fulvivirga maritima]|uniref:DUF4286 family protein n=1 Tax=Fulvivirga maritima TaxID=2904247 RepID=UPI001F1F2858|nr:DUF4286 family protein [Fulvivirga maritima]UII28708.1 DUF4286 family protein [Fulvivirga maritima]
MVLYNVTIGIDSDVEQEWLAWMKTTYIPTVMATGLFKDCQIFKVLGQDEEASVSYSFQYFTESVDKVVDYLDNHAPTIVQLLHKNYKDKHVAFRTLLQQVE